MQEEVPKEQVWQGGIRFERANKDSGQSVEGFSLHVFFFFPVVYRFLFVIRMAQKMFSSEHLGVCWSRSTR